MDQPIVGFHRDAERHWLAELACGHNQHVRHDPPWTSRPWVTTPEGRAATLGRMLACRKCDQGAPRDWHGAPAFEIERPAATQETTMDIEGFMRGYQEAWQRRDEKLFCALFAPDGVYRNTPFAVQRGHDELARYWQRVKLQQDVVLRYDILASHPGGGVAHWHVTYQVASEELFRIWAASTGTNLVARKAGEPLPRMALDGVLQASFGGGLCTECRLWWHALPIND